MAIVKLARAWLTKLVEQSQNVMKTRIHVFIAIVEMFLHKSFHDFAENGEKGS